MKKLKYVGTFEELGKKYNSYTNTFDYRDELIIMEDGNIYKGEAQYFILDAKNIPDLVKDGKVVMVDEW